MHGPQRNAPASDFSLRAHFFIQTTTMNNGIEQVGIKGKIGMGNTPVHIHMYRLLKHITEMPLSFPLQVPMSGKKALVGRQRKMARRKRKTQQLLQKVQVGWKTDKQNGGWDSDS